MKNKKICRYCGKEIDLNQDKFVLLGTYEERSSLDESYFHYDCFVEWFNEKLDEKTNSVRREQPKQIKGIGFFGGSQDLNDPNMMGDMKNIAESPEILGDVMNMAQGLLGGLDLGVVDVKKDAEKMTQGIKKTAEKIKEKIGKKNEKKKEKTGVEAGKEPTK